MRRLLLAVVFCVVTFAVDDAAHTKGEGGAGSGCSGRKDLAGQCMKVRGRLRSYDGYPACRIWPVGSNRLLGVADSGSLPDNVACGKGFEVYADFMVCPLTTAKPNGLQLVCVASASNLRASEIKENER